MKSIRYIDGVTTLSLDRDACVGCRMCMVVCPHQVFAMEEKKARIVDGDGCMECGGCAKNCPVGAISVSPGVGCAALIINRWLSKRGIAVKDGCC